MTEKISKWIKLFDCTLRNGGYYNSWDFDKYESAKILIDSMIGVYSRQNVKNFLKEHFEPFQLSKEIIAD